MLKVKHALLIVNPHSGSKKGEFHAAYVREKLEAEGIASALFLSHSVRDLEQFLEKTRLQSFNLVGLIGGDGTMHAFLNIILNRFDEVPVPVALFPCGTGNAFNYDIGCSSVDETLNTILAGESSYVDIAEVNCGDGRLWSFNILGCGLVAEINKLAEKMRFLGASRYTVASLIKLLANPKTHLRIITEQGQLEGRMSFVLACNTRYTGKGMMMAPRAQLNDGKFDVVVVKACSALKLLRLFPKIFRGKHLGADVITYLQTDRLEVSNGAQLLPTNIDGEIKGSAPFTLKVHPNKVKVFVGRK